MMVCEHGEAGARGGCAVCFDRLLAERDAEIARLRGQVLEEAARVADDYRRQDNTMLTSAAEHIATRIRALAATDQPKGKP